ncbi:MAG: tetratricopeptide repeat protein [Phycisphaerales bacterium]|nr:tetratricopeptide repeat protein [Phycisphaerales bacterium]
MASRLNIRFIVILFAVIVVLGVPAAWFVYSKVHRTGDYYVKLAEEAELVGDYDLASRMYARAVGHEQSNVEWIEKWRDTIVRVVPENRTDAVDEWSWLQQIYRTLAEVQQDDAGAQADWLEMNMKRMARFGARQGDWVALANQAEESLRHLPDPREAGFLADSDEERAYCRVLRFRSIANLEQMARTQLPRLVRSQTQEDLQRCADALPADDQVSVALASWYEIEAKRLREIDFNPLDADTSMARAGEMIASFAERNPDNAAGLNVYAQYLYITERQEAAQIEDEEAALLALAEAGARALEIITQAERASLADPDIAAVMRLAAPGGMLVQLDRENGLDRALALTHRAMEVHKNSSELLRLQALLLERAGEREQAIASLQCIVDLPDPGTGLDSVALYYERPQALNQQFDLTMDQWRAAEDDAEKETLLASASAIRERYLNASTSTAADADEWLMNGKLAHARQNYAEAVNWLQQVQTNRGGALDVTTMLLLADCLEKQGQLGDAEALLSEAFTRYPNYPPLATRLVNIQDRLGKGEEACDTIETVVSLYASDTEFVAWLKTRHEDIAVKHGLQDRIGMFEGGEIDPIRRLLLQADGLVKRGNTAEARSLIDAALAEHPDDPALLQTMVRILLRMREDGTADEQDMLLALDHAKRLQDLQPDDQRVRRLIELLEAEDLIEFQVEGIQDLDLPAVRKELMLWQLYTNNNMPAEADAALERAKAADPNDPEVVELTFLGALADEDWDAAWAQANLARDRNLDQANGLIYQTRLQLAQREPKAAIKSASDALELNSYLADAYRLRGQAYYAIGDMTSARTDLERALQSRPNNATIIKMLAQVLMEQNARDRALELVRTARNTDQEDQALLALWVDLEMSNGDPEQVVEHFQREYAGNPQDATIARRYALLLMELARFEAARPVIDALLEDHANNLSMVRLDAVWHAEAGDVEAGENVFRTYIGSLDEATMEAAPYLAYGSFLLRYRGMDQAVFVMERAVPYQTPERLEADWTIGQVCMERRDFIRAAEHFGKVADAKTDLSVAANREAWKRLVQCLLQNGDLDEAESRLNRMSDMVASDDIEYYLLLAELYAARDNVPKARQTLDQAVQAQPNNHLAYFYRARHNSNDPAMHADVTSDINHALEIRPTYRPAIELRIRLLVDTGNLTGAVAEQSRLLQFYPDDADLRLKLAQNLWAVGQKNEAETVLIEGAEQEPDDPGWPFELGQLLYRGGEVERAQPHLRRAYEISGRRANLGMLYAQVLIESRDNRNPELALHLLERHADELDGIPNYYNVKGLALAQLHRPDEARVALAQGYRALGAVGDGTRGDAAMRWFNAVLGIYGTNMDAIRSLIDSVTDGNPPPSLRLAFGQHMVTQTDRADEAMELLRSVDTEETELATRISAVRAIGMLQYRQNEYAAAVQTYRRLLEDVLPPIPESGQEQYGETRLQAANNTAYLLSEELGDPAGALPYAELAASLAPDDPNVLDTLGWVQFLTGDIAGAKITLTRSLERGETMAALLHITEVLLTEDDADGARLYLDKARGVAHARDADSQQQIEELTERLNTVAGDG